jgi:hypothetical protein
MVRLYITLDEFANRQAEGIETIFWLQGGVVFSASGVVHHG